MSDVVLCQSVLAKAGPWENAREVRAGPLQNVIPLSGEAMVCDSGQEIDKIGIGSGGSGSSKVRACLREANVQMRGGHHGNDRGGGGRQFSGKEGE